MTHSTTNTAPEPHQSSLASGFSIISQAIGFVFVYAIFALRDWLNRSHSLLSRVLSWILGGFHRTGSLLSKDFVQRWGTNEQLQQRFRDNAKMPRLEVEVRVNRDE